MVFGVTAVVSLKGRTHTSESRLAKAVGFPLGLQGCNLDFKIEKVEIKPTKCDC